MINDKSLRSICWNIVDAFLEPGLVLIKDQVSSSLHILHITKRHHLSTIMFSFIS